MLAKIGQAVKYEIEMNFIRMPTDIIRLPTDIIRSAMDIIR